MASGNRDNFRLSRSTWLLLAAWFIAPPVGAVLTVVRIIALALNAAANNSSSSGSSGDKINTMYASQHGKGENGTHTMYASQYHKQDGAQTTQNTVHEYHAPSAASSAHSTSSQNSQKTKSEDKKKKLTPSDILKIIGYVLIGISAIISISGIGGLRFTEWLSGTLPNVLLFLCSGLGMIWGSGFLQRRSVRLARIRAIIGKHESFNLSKLAAASDTSIKQVRRDVQRLIDKGEFGEQAYIDLGTNNFMRNPEAKADDPMKFDYKDLYGGLFSGKKKKNGSESDKADADNVDLASDNDDFKTIIREIRRLNFEIADESVSDKIFKIEDHTKNIFEYVSAHSGSESQIRTFLNYYLPTTLKLLESYSRIEKVGVAGENMQKSKESIESTLDALENAFKRQMDELFKNESLDISSDISVLETMMQKDGLNAKNDFDLSGYTDKISDDIGAGGAAAAPRPEIK